MFRTARFSSLRVFSKAVTSIFCYTLSLLFNSYSFSAEATVPNDALMANCELFLQQTGLADVLNKLPQWIDAEIDASKAFLASKPELKQQIKQRLISHFVDQRHTALCANMAEKAGEANIELAGVALNTADVLQLGKLRAGALADDEHFNEYLKKMRGMAPLESRQEWIRKLDQNSGVSAFKARLWAELRKTVLWSVGVSSAKTFSETELEHELISFQREAMTRAELETSQQWLYAYKTVPDAMFQQLFLILDKPATQKTAAAVLAAVAVMGKEARQ